MKPYLSVIIPAYNEAKNLPLTLISVNEILSRVDYSYEVIVVNDGSKDATAEAVLRLVHVIKNLRFINNKENHGKGWVVRQGMLEAQGEIRLFMDADNATTVDQFSKMIPYFKEGYQIVIGSRDVKGAILHPPQPWYRRLAGNVGNIIIQIVLLPGIWDTQCGFKAFTEEAAKKIFSINKLDRWGFDFEALVLGKKMGYKIKEIPVIWVNSAVSRVKASAFIQVLIEVLKVRWWLIKNRYQLK